MVDIIKPYKMITDYITGRKIPEVGSEGNRQLVEQILVRKRGYRKEDIEVDVELRFTIAGEEYRSVVDLVVCAGKTPDRFMLVKCVAGSLASRERETTAAARILDHYQIPLAVVSDGKNAVVLDTVSGRKIGEGLEAIPSRKQAEERLETMELLPCPEERKVREQLIFRTYDREDVNTARHLSEIGLHDPDLEWLSHRVQILSP